MENKIKAQRVALEICFQTHKITGKTRLRVQVSEEIAAIGHISLFCKQINILAVSLAGTPLSFAAPSSEAWINLLPDVVAGTQAYDKLIQAQAALYEFESSQGGLLKVVLPLERRYADTVLLDIDFEVTQPAAGLVFYTSKGREFLISDGLMDTVHCWVPCDDQCASSYPFGVEIIVPKAYTAVASGELAEICELAGDRKAYRYQCQDHMLIGTFGICVGQFAAIVPDPNLSWITHFAVSRLDDLRYTVSNPVFTYANLVSYLGEVTGQDPPFSSQFLVFLPDLPRSLSFTSLALISDTYLLSPKVLEGQEDTLRTLAWATAFNWFGGYFTYQTLPDLWMIIALQAYLANIYYQEKFKSDALRYLIYKEIDRYCKLVENGQEFRPLSSQCFAHPNELLCDEVFCMKAPLILHMIESKIGKELLGVIKQISTQGRQLSTTAFLKACRRPFGAHLTEFSRYWIYGTGAPFLECHFEYIARQHAVELTLMQRPLVWSHLKSKANSQFPEQADNDFQVPMRVNLMRVYKGPLTVIIHETDKFEKDSAHQTIFVEGETFKTLIPCKKPIRKTTSTKRRDDSDKRKLYETLESPVLWIRVDPDFEILRRVKVVQSRAMWYQQLEEEREDPIGQIDAMLMLSHDVKNVSLKIFTSLYDVVRNSEKHYLVRVQACKMMAALSDPSNGYKGLDLLVYYYQEKHFDKAKGQPLPNSFRSKADYLVDKAVLEAITSVKDMSLSFNFHRLRVNSNYISEFLRDLLRYSDNSANEYDDSHWRGWLLEQLCSCNNPTYTEETLDEVWRQMKLDAALQSSNLVVLQHAIAGFVKVVEGFGLWTHPKAGEIWAFLENQLGSSPFHIQEAVIRAIIKVKAKESRSILPGFRLLLRRVTSAPVLLSGLNGGFRLITEILLGNEELLAEAKASTMLRDLMWGMLCSPYASVQHYYCYSLGALYRLIYGFDWGGETLDAAWQAQLDQAMPTLSTGEGGFARHQAVAMEEGSFEPVDLATGDWKTWSFALLDRMMNHDYAEPFCEPVDHIKLGLKDYLDIIKRPMDFSTIKQKLESGVYADFKGFCSDIDLVFDNCRTYNMEGSLIFSWAETLDAYFQLLTKPIKDKLGIVKEDITKVKLKLEGS